MEHASSPALTTLTTSPITVGWLLAGIFVVTNCLEHEPISSATSAAAVAHTEMKGQWLVSEEQKPDSLTLAVAEQQQG